MTRNYDSTVARIAGNIASGIIGRMVAHKLDSADTVQIQNIATYSVSLARAIVDSTRDTEPKEK